MRSIRGLVAAALTGLALGVGTGFADSVPLMLNEVGVARADRSGWSQASEFVSLILDSGWAWAAIAVLAGWLVSRGRQPPPPETTASAFAAGAVPRQAPTDATAGNATAGPTAGDVPPDAAPGHLLADAAAGNAAADPTAGDVPPDAAPGNLLADAAAGTLLADATAGNAAADPTAGDVPPDAAPGHLLADAAADNTRAGTAAGNTPASARAGNAPRPFVGALAGFVALSMATVAFYGVQGLFADGWDGWSSQVRFWLVRALVLGMPLGALGVLARRGGGIAGALAALVVPVGAVLNLIVLPLPGDSRMARPVTVTIWTGAILGAVAILLRLARERTRQVSPPDAASS